MSRASKSITRAPRRRRTRTTIGGAPNKEAPGIEWTANADRLETIINCLSGCEGVSVDHALAARLLAHCHHQARRGRRSISLDAAIVRFCADHGQSVDWVFLGKPDSMICELAKGTSSIRPPSLRVIEGGKSGLKTPKRPF